MLTVPNLVTLRAAGRRAAVPVAWCSAPHADGWAVAVLAIGGTTDWVDGFLARRLGQVSRLGELLDPLADRLYIVATVVALTIRDVRAARGSPWPCWPANCSSACCLLVLRRYGYGPPPVHYVGKAATFLLLIALPCCCWPR